MAISGQDQPEGNAMRTNRRGFLHATGLAGAGLATPALGAGAEPPPARRPAGPSPMPRGMSFCTLRGTAGGGTLGIRTERGVIDVKRAEAELRLGVPTTIEDVIHGRGNVGAVPRLVTAAPKLHKRGVVLPLADVRFGPCVTNPEKIICAGLNYRAHAAEAQQPVPPAPIWFNKFNTCLNHHGGSIDVTHCDATQFDYEAELVIVIGRTARNVTEADALNYVFGYACGQDFSVRDLQRRSSQWMLGKAGDGWGPVGPWIVTAEQIDPANLKIECLVNNEVRQDSNTGRMIFDCKQQIADLSKYITLKPGDVIFTGTPEGVIAGMPAERQVWLKAGDRVVTRIEKLGELEVRLV
jgi:2-keto-4-pentenoate hydratase/2-oxohepta-3-ene-1,7-dioic acid hydratase in catechol pathway